MRSNVSVALSVLILFSAGSSLAATAKEKAAATAKLLAAATAGDQDDILEAIAAGADVNARDADKNTPLILSSVHSLFGKQRQVVEALVKAKARVEAVNADGLTALMGAASAGQDGMVRLILQNDAKVDATDNDGWTALHYASAAGHWSAVKELIAAEANVNKAEKKGWTPLVLALFNGRGTVAEYLIKAGAKMPETGPNGMSMVLMSAYGRDLASVRHVLATDAPLNAVDSDGWTALAVASLYGDGQIVMELLRAGADASIKDGEGKTALDRALERENAEIAAILGGPWKKRASTGGTTLSIPCAPLGGTVTAHFAVDNTALVVATTFPKPLTWYLGGGSMNRASSAKGQIYEGSFTPTYLLKEGKGPEYGIDYSQYGTSVTLEYQDGKGNTRSKPVYANVLDVDIERDGTIIDSSDLGDDTPRATNEGGVLVTRIPLSLLNLTSGKTVRATAQIGTCKAVTGKLKL